MNKLKFFALFFVLALVATGAPAVLAQDSESWDPSICEGTEGYVFRTVDGTTSSLDEESGCKPDEEQSWLIVEPWNRTTGVMNPDRACLAINWADVVSTANRMSWTEGSIWRVSAEMLENPLVVDCSDVQVRADLGLNPGEGQLELRQARGTILRANELLNAAGSSMSEYASTYPDDPISELFLLLTILNMGASN